MEAYNPGDLLRTINPDAGEPLQIPDPVVLVREQPIHKKRPLEREHGPTVAIKPERKRANTLRTKHDADERNDRTVFVGNVPTSATKKTIKKLFTGRAEVDSIRFRSASFSQQSLPKKVAFIQQQFHDSRDTMNCYVVLKDASMVGKAFELNGTLFEGHHIRVDRITSEVTHDDRRCVFVGNLPFNITEDDLWEFFQTCGTINYVRCIRDRYANVGKGFAYVQFVNQDSVRLALAFHDGLFKGRKIRVFKSGAKSKDNPAIQRIKGKNKKSTAGKKRAVINDKKAKLSVGKKSKSLAGKKAKLSTGKKNKSRTKF